MDKDDALVAIALTNSKVSYKPTIFCSRDNAASQELDTQQTSSNVAGDKANQVVKVHDLWEKGSD